MTITYVSYAVDSYDSASPLGSRTVSVNIGTRTNGLLVVGVGLYNTNPSWTPYVSTMTYAGTSMSQATADTISNGATDYITELWYLTAPTNGTNNLVVTFNASQAGRFFIIASWYDGANQTQASVLGNTNKGNGTTDPSVSLTPPEDNCLIVSHYFSEANSELTVGSGETKIAGYDFGGQVSGGSYVIQTTAGAQTVDWSGTDAYWSMCVASFKQLAGSDTALTVADLTCSVTMDAGGTLTVAASMLGVGDLTCAVTTDTPALTVQVSILGVGDLTCAVTADNVTVTLGTGDTELVVQDLTCTANIDEAGTLTVQATITTVDGLTCAVTIETPALTVAASLLGVGDLTAAVTTDTPALTVQAAVLGVGDLSTATTIDAPALTAQAAIQNVGDLTAATTMEEPGLTAQSNLTVADIRVVTYIDGPSTAPAAAGDIGMAGFLGMLFFPRKRGKRKKYYNRQRG